MGGTYPTLFSSQEAHNLDQKIFSPYAYFCSPSQIIISIASISNQFITYRSALCKEEPDRKLYLAVPTHIYDRFFVMPLIQEIVEQNQMLLLVYNIAREAITRWKK